jgi:ribosomal protein S27AE
MREDFDARWNELAQEVISGLKEWRVQHAKATLREIEAALDERLGHMRARLMEDVALASAAADVSAAAGEERPRCPTCGTLLSARGSATREVTTQFDQTVRLKRSYAVCPACGAGVFPPR